MNLPLDTRIHKHNHSSIMPHIKIFMINLAFRLLHNQLFGQEIYAVSCWMLQMSKWCLC